MYHNYIFEEFSKNEDKISVRRSVYIDNNLPMHGHSFMEIVYIESGEGTHYLNDKEYTVRAGDLILLDYRSIHTFRPITANFEWINILFKPEFIKDRLFNEVGANNVIRLSIFKTLIDNTDGKFHDLVLSGVNSSFTSLVHLMLYEYENLSRENNYILRNYLVILLSKVSFYVQNGPTGASENVNVLIRQITQEILENLQNELTLSYVANKVHLTPKYLSRFFKQQTGKNFIDFVHEKRIEEACRLLEQTDMAVNDIMLCCGMKSSKFFYKLFKEKTGVTPGDYRKI